MCRAAQLRQIVITSIWVNIDISIIQNAYFTSLDFLHLSNISEYISCLFPNGLNKLLNFSLGAFFFSNKVTKSLKSQQI